MFMYTVEQEISMLDNTLEIYAKALEMAKDECVKEQLTYEIASIKEKKEKLHNGETTERLFPFYKPYQKGVNNDLIKLNEKKWITSNRFLVDFSKLNIEPEDIDSVVFKDNTLLITFRDHKDFPLKDILFNICGTDIKITYLGPNYEPYRVMIFKNCEVCKTEIAPLSYSNDDIQKINILFNYNSVSIEDGTTSQEDNKE